MGEVWAATLADGELGFQKFVALKVLRTSEIDSGAVVMFFDEAKAAAALQHAAIVPTVDLGRDGDVLFIAMDLVRGPSLTALLQRLVKEQAQVPPHVVAYIGIQIASALDYAHERATSEGRPLRLIHRDVSPHNVLVDGSGAVRLTDFGVAKTAIQVHESRVGTVRGKPSYMAPEQVMGQDLDARTDIFSLGIVLYETATLKRLFGRCSPIASMDAVLKHTPRRISEFVPDFPEAISSVIARALEKDPQSRYQRAQELRDALTVASQALPRAPSAPRDLSMLVEAIFEQNAFDIETRTREASPDAPRDVVATLQSEQVPRNLATAPSLGGFTPFTGSAPSLLGPPRRARTLAGLATFSFAIVLATGVASLMGKGTPEPKPPAELSGRAAATSGTHAPRARARAPETAGTAEMLDNARVVEAASDLAPPAAPPSVATLRGRRSPRQISREQRTVESIPNRTQDNLEGLQKEIVLLLRDIREADVEAAERMYATLTEAVTEANLDALRVLRREATARIEQYKSTRNRSTRGEPTPSEP